MTAAHQYSAAAHWSGSFDEAGLRGWAEALRKRLDAPEVSLGLVFMSPRFFPHAKQVLEVVRVHAEVPLLMGCSSQSLIANGEELENDPGVVLVLFHLPGAQLKATRFIQEQVDEANGGAYWHLESGVAPAETNGWLAFLDPFHLDGEAWLRTWNEAYAPLPVMGGIASGEYTEQLTQLYLNGDVYEDGGLALSVGGQVRLSGITSQGCTPIGQTWTITQAEQNLIHRIANLPAYEVLAQTFGTLSPDEQQNARGNLFIGLVVNEYLEEFQRGDFLIRNILGADPKSGTMAVGAFPRVGQTLQFQRRSATAATEDLQDLLARAKVGLAGKTIYGGCLCSCNGRGTGLFGEPNHDAALIEAALGPLTLGGFFCNGEIGPVGDRNFLHGYTASLALFVSA